MKKRIQTVQSGLSSVQTNDVCNNNNNNKRSNKALKVIVMALIDSHTAKQQSNTLTIKAAIRNFRQSLYYFLSIL